MMPSRSFINEVLSRCAPSTVDHGGIKAAEVFLWLLERVHGRRPQQLARRLPLLVVLLAPPYPCAWAGRIRGHVEASPLRPPIVVHAHLREEILADGSPLGPLHPIDPLAATINVVGERIEGLGREDFKISEETILHRLAILQVDSCVSQGMTLQHALEAMGDKDSVCIDLHNPICHLDLCRGCHLFPDLLEHACVHPSSPM